MSSRQDALQAARDYLATLLELQLAPRPGDLGNAAGLGGLATVAPLHQQRTLSVRSGGVIARRNDAVVTTSTVTSGTQTLAREVTSAPRHRLRVFVDIRHGQDEEAHHASVDAFLGVHPIGEARAIPDAQGNATERLLFITSESSVATGDVFTTTFTGWLEYDFVEGSITRDYPMLRAVTVYTSDDPAFVNPSSTLPALEVEPIQEAP